MLSTFLDGCCCLGFFTAGLFFLKFWKNSKDCLFLAFASAFALLGVERIVTFAVAGVGQEHPYTYLLRLVAFCVIIGGIIAKNRR